MLVSPSDLLTLEAKNDLLDGLNTALTLDNQKQAEEIDTLKRLVIDMFEQSCVTQSQMYNHHFLSAYENAQRYLIEIGEIDEEDCICDA